MILNRAHYENMFTKNLVLYSDSDGSNIAIN